MHSFYLSKHKRKSNYIISESTTCEEQFKVINALTSNAAIDHSVKPAEPHHPQKEY